MNRRDTETRKGRYHDEPRSQRLQAGEDGARAGTLNPEAVEFIHLGCSSGAFLLYLPHGRIEIGPDTNQQRANTSSYKHQANSSP